MYETITRICLWREEDSSIGKEMEEYVSMIVAKQMGKWDLSYFVARFPCLLRKWGIIVVDFEKNNFFTTKHMWARDFICINVKTNSISFFLINQTQQWNTFLSPLFTSLSISSLFKSFRPNLVFPFKYYCPYPMQTSLEYFTLTTTAVLFFPSLLKLTQS